MITKKAYIVIKLVSLKVDEKKQNRKKKKLNK